MNTSDTEEPFSPEQSLKVITGMIEKVQDDKLRRVAKKRVSFKISLATALLVNGMLICIWYFTTGPHSYFWPMWPLLVWLVALIIIFSEAYLGTSIFSEEKEYDRLKRAQTIKK
ncbi:MAG TPA: 2TM domain-containing protein [Segetibacter sp.]